MTRLLAPQASLLNLALLFALAAAGLFVWQCWLLAQLFSGWLVAWQQGGLGDAQAQLLTALLPWLEPRLTVTRQTVGYFRLEGKPVDFEVGRWPSR